MASRPWRKLFPAPGFGPLHDVHFAHAHVGPPERVIIDRAMSVSYMAALPAAERERVTSEIRTLIDSAPALSVRREVTVPYITMAFHCHELSAGSAA